VAAALDRRAAKELAAHEAAGRVGVFEVEVWDDPAAYNAGLEDETDGYGDGYAAVRAASSARWYVRVTGGSGELSAGLPETVLGCVLELRGGLFDDPQECRFRVVSRQGRAPRAEPGSVVPPNTALHLTTAQSGRRR
jgi:hypothetical protein